MATTDTVKECNSHVDAHRPVPRSRPDRPTGFWDLNPSGGHDHGRLARWRHLTEHIEASYEAGVLSLRIPVAEKAKPRKIAITSKDTDRQAIDA